MPRITSLVKNFFRFLWDLANAEECKIDRGLVFGKHSPTRLREWRGLQTTVSSLHRRRFGNMWLLVANYLGLNLVVAKSLEHAFMENIVEFLLGKIVLWYGWMKILIPTVDLSLHLFSFMSC